MQCQATAKGSGKQCERQAMTGKQVCYMHGGKTPGGIASPHFKNGRYSKYLPDGLLARYQEARDDPELLALRDEIALMDVRLGQLLERATAGENERLWPSLTEAFEALQQAIHAKNPQALLESLSTVERLIQGGASQYEAWVELDRVIEQRRKLVETERKRLVEMQQMITTQQAMTLVAALTAAVRQYVEDRHILAAVSAEFVRLIGAAGGPGLGVGSDGGELLGTGRAGSLQR